MSEPCSDLISFADGELDPERAERFRAHLATCEACRTGLIEAIQLDARLSTLSPPGPVSSEPTGAPDKPPVDEPAAPAAESVIKHSHGRWHGRLAAWIGGAALPIAAVAVYVFSTERLPPDPFVGIGARPGDTRIAYAGAAGYRPVREAARGSAGSAEYAIPYKVLDDLQTRRDGYGLAIAQMFNGEPAAKVVTALGALRQTSAVRSDLAAVELSTTSNDNLEPVLAELETLRNDWNPAVARPARWNYALALSRLQLPNSAARAFRAIAAEAEPGWADEARSRAEREEQHAREFHDHWYAAWNAGEALVHDGSPLPAGVIDAFPSLVRACFYDAVRTAPSRARIDALGELAAALDRPSGSRVLSKYVARVAGLDFARRAAVAGDYSQLLSGHPIGPALGRELAADHPSDAAADIVMGAIYQLDAVPDNLDEYRALIQRIGGGDPWFDIILTRNEATAARKRGDWFAAEAALRRGEARCGDRAFAFQCLSLARELGVLYEDLSRTHDALGVLRTAASAARSAGEWVLYRRIIYYLADTARYSSSTALTRAYATEALAVDRDDRYRVQSSLLLASASVIDVDGPGARRYFEDALRGAPLDLFAANLLADIARLDPQPGDLARLQGWLATARASSKTTPAQRALFDEIEGRFMIERDAAAGAALLERAIAAADALPHDPLADKTRAGAYSVLGLDAGRRGDAAAALGFVARDLGLAAPGSCAVGILAEDERAAIVVRDADGRDRTRYVPSRGPHGPALAVPDDLAAGLASCAHIAVMAPAAMQGQPRVLPATMPWSYAATARGRAAPAAPAGAPRTVIVTGVTPPAQLALAPLEERAIAGSASVDVLSGAQATPARVLSAIAGATEIQFHTHALLDVGVSDASHLVLSPEPQTGQYALTAEAIRGVALHGHPVVVLAACHSAQGARYQHAPWSLPDAFLAVGARAVFAAATDVPDREAGPFFDRVLARVRGGADPARALAAERTGEPSSWTADVILFE